ncbi:6-bladed beta-propeller [Bacteroides fragilis]|nr:6-bladed beta-propeller [Bacteroides fragilis]MCE9305964.1 6-bladed beta-propeller [Bacteroides fragilis]
MDKIYLWFLLLISCSCSHTKEKVSNDMDSSLCIIDVTCEYPVEKVNIHDVADVEYVPLEMTRNSLLASDCSAFRISDDYITVASGVDNGNIFFFNRKGRYLWTFNRRGGSAEEYSSITAWDADFGMQEIYIYDSFRKKIYIYSFDGRYKRSHALPMKDCTFIDLYNYDKDYLIGYNRFYDFRKKKKVDTHPYYLIDKQSGEMSSIGIVVDKPISEKVHTEIVKFPGGAYKDQVLFLITALIKNGDAFLIADYALDTIYSYRHHKLVPIAVQTPSVYASDPPVIVACELYTDSYLHFRIIPMYYNPSAPMSPMADAPELVLNRHTGKIAEWKMYDYNYSSDIERPVPTMILQSADRENYGISMFTAERLIEQYQAGGLKGELKDIASRLSIDDNDILMICKYK